MAIDNNNIIYAIQVKYCSNINKIISFGELSTFSALVFGTNVNINNGILFTNCYYVCDELHNNKYTHILYETLNNKCDNLFFQNIREYIGIKTITKYNLLKPLNHQKIILDKCIQFYEKENNGRLYLACGSGKTFISYWLCIQELQLDKIYIVVPSLYLLSQTYEVWMRELQYNKYKYHFILVGSDMDKKENFYIGSEYKPTTDINKITLELENNKKIIVITTYHSSNLLASICKKINYKFDFGIYDEAHRTVGNEKVNKCLILSNRIKKTIYDSNRKNL